MLLVECAVVSVVILAAAAAMFVLFRYDPDASAHPAREHHRELALNADLGHIGAFLSRISQYRSTRTAAAILAALLFGVLEDAAHNLVLGLQLHPALKAMADGSIVAACGGAVVWVMLTGVSRRRQSLATQLEAAGELNGQVRNALEVILLASHTAPAGDRRMLVESVERIEATLDRLQRLLPPTDTPEKRHANHPDSRDLIRSAG